MGTLTYILISLAFSAFFSGMEIAFISSNKLRFELDKKERSLSSKILGIFYRNPNLFISTMLVGNNIALVVYGLQMAIVLEPFIAKVVANEALIVFIQSVISTILILFAGEFIPKTIFKLNPNLSLNIFAIPLFIISGLQVLFPAIFFDFEVRGREELEKFTSGIRQGRLGLFYTAKSGRCSAKFGYGYGG